MGSLGGTMAEAYEVLRAKDKTIAALASALDKACEALENISFAESVDEAVVLAEATNEEIMEELISQGVDKDLLPNI